MRLKLLLLFLSVISLNNRIVGQDISYADSIANAGQYELAAFEYEKEIYVCTNDSFKNILLLKKAMCCKSNADFKSCYVNLNRINTNNVSLNNSCLYEKAVCHFMMNNNAAAYNELLQINLNKADSSLSANTLLLFVLILNEMERIDESKEKLLELISICDIGLSKDSVHLMYKTLRLKSERKAKILSILFPGLGQFYARKPLHGISSILLEAAAITYMITSIYTGYYISSFLTGFSFTTRFYIGGQKNSVRLVETYNHREMLSFNNSIMGIIQKNHPIK